MRKLALCSFLIMALSLFSCDGEKLLEGMFWGINKLAGEGFVPSPEILALGEFDPTYKEPYVRTGDWFITILITKIPLIGLIMLVVWAVDKGSNPSKANWAKAKLIWYALGFAIALLFLFIVGFGVFLGFFDNFKFPDF